MEIFALSPWKKDIGKIFGAAALRFLQLLPHLPICQTTMHLWSRAPWHRQEVIITAMYGRKE
jgi:hypothetical protein